MAIEEITHKQNMTQKRKKQSKNIYKVPDKLRKIKRKMAKESRKRNRK